MSFRDFRLLTYGFLVGVMTMGFIVLIVGPR